MTEHEAQPAAEREQARPATGREQPRHTAEREQTHDDGAQVSTGKETAGAHEAAIPELVIISGMSGAGRSTAAKCLEDLGWFVVDNLPPALIPTMVELGARSQGNVARICATSSRTVQPPSRVGRPSCSGVRARTAARTWPNWARTAARVRAGS